MRYLRISTTLSALLLVTAPIQAASKSMSAALGVQQAISKANSITAAALARLTYDAGKKPSNGCSNVPPKVGECRPQCSPHKHY